MRFSRGFRRAALPEFRAFMPDRDEIFQQQVMENLLILHLVSSVLFVLR